MSKKLLFTVSDSTSLAELYRRLSHGIDIIEQHIGYAHKRALPTVKQAIDHIRRFVSGELGTDEGAKLWFKKLTKLAEEVGDMTAAQSAYILAAAEVAHAASHMGHVNMALSRGRRTEADAEYVKLQTAYVNFALKGVDEFLALADGKIQPHFAFNDETAHEAVAA